MIINTLGNLLIDDDWLETLTTEEFTQWLKNYIKNNFNPDWGVSVDTSVWVCPLTNRLVSFGGTEPDWRELLGY